VYGPEEILRIGGKFQRKLDEFY